MDAILQFLAEWFMIAIAACAGWRLMLWRQEREDEIEREDNEVQL